MVASLGTKDGAQVNGHHTRFGGNGLRVKVAYLRPFWKVTRSQEERLGSSGVSSIHCLEFSAVEKWALSWSLPLLHASAL